MEILYVIVGGGLVALGFFMASKGSKPDPKTEVKPDLMREAEPMPVETEQLPKSGISINDQIEAMMGYDPHKALKNGEQK